MKNVDQFYQCEVSAPSYLPGKEPVTWQLRCYLQIFLGSSGEQIVLISDLGCEISWFIPRRLELLATQIVQEFNLDPDRLIWIEHDPTGTGALDSHNLDTELSQVLFHWEGGKASNPQWYNLSPKIIKTLTRKISPAVSVQVST